MKDTEIQKLLNNGQITIYQSLQLLQNAQMINALEKIAAELLSANRSRYPGSFRYSTKTENDNTFIDPYLQTK